MRTAASGADASALYFNDRLWNSLSALREKPLTLVEAPMGYGKTVAVREYVPVPADLTRACPEARAEERTVQAVVEAYNANILALRQCNRQLRLIRALEVGEP